MVPLKSDDVRISISVTLTVVSDIFIPIIELSMKIFGPRQAVVNSRSMGVHDIINNNIRIRRELDSAPRSAQKSQNYIIIIIITIEIAV